MFRYRFGIRPDGNAPEDPARRIHGQESSCTSPARWRKSRRVPAQTPEQVDAALRARADDIVSGTALETAAAPGRQSPDRVEWPHACRVCASGARAARSEESTGAVPRGGRAFGGVSRAHMWDSTRQILKRRYRDGDAAIDGYAEDYAYLIFGLMELFQVERRSPMACVGENAPETAGRAVLGRGRTAAGSTPLAPTRASSCG